MADEAIPTDEDVGALGPVFDDLREVFLVAPSAEVADRHLAMMFAALDDKVAPHTVVPMRSRRRWIAGVAAVGALSLTTGLAAAGELPKPLQQRVSAAISHVGIAVPRGDDTDTPDPGTTDDPTTVVSTPRNDGNGQSEDAPGHGGNAPGQSEDAPGQGGNTPGQSENAPGHGGEDPGKSGDAPGHTDSTSVRNGNGNGNGGGNDNGGGNGNGNGNDKTPPSSGPSTSKVPGPPTTKAPKK